MLETQKRKEAILTEKDHGSSKRCSNLPMVLHVMKGVVTNPIVFMTVIGLAGNFVFSQKVPYILSDILDVFGEYVSNIKES